MNLPRLFFISAAVIFVVIGVVSLFKGGDKPIVVSDVSVPVEIDLEQDLRPVIAEAGAQNVTHALQVASEEKIKRSDDGLPDANRIEELFRKGEPKLPIVETIVYKSRAAWQEGRPAWLSDYASHFKTSRHFIARSLNGKPDYFKQDLAVGDRFNVFKLDKEIEFHLVIDTSRLKMWFYYVDKGTNERVLLKTYAVGLGRVESSLPSGLLTPLGSYQLGERIAIYKPKQIGSFNNEQVEMIRIFGTRWIPFEKALENASAEAKGFGIHGAPWVDDSQGGLVENRSCIGRYESDGCVRLASDDIEEIFAIIVTKPTFVHLVKDFFDAKLPGHEAGAK